MQLAGILVFISDWLHGMVILFFLSLVLPRINVKKYFLRLGILLVVSSLFDLTRHWLFVNFYSRIVDLGEYSSVVLGFYLCLGILGLLLIVVSDKFKSVVI